MDVSGNTDRSHNELHAQYPSLGAQWAELYFRIMRFQRHLIYSEKHFEGKKSI